MQNVGTPESNSSSPLSFSVPASLNEYMARYTRRDESGAPSPSGDIIPTASLSPPSFPVRSWFDEGGDNVINAGGTVPGTFAGGIMAPVDSGCEDEDPQQFRPQTRSGYNLRGGASARFGVTQQSAAAASAVAERRGGTSSTTRSWRLEGLARARVVPVSPMIATDYSPSPREAAQTLPERRWGEAVLEGAEGPFFRPGFHSSPNARSSPRRPSGWVFQHSNLPEAGGPQAAGRAPRVGTPDSNRTSESGRRRGRRSLSDFLREIEEMVRAQRAESETPVTRPQSAQHSQSTRSRPLSPTTRAPDYPSASPTGGTRYVPPPQRRRNTERTWVRDLVGEPWPPQLPRASELWTNSSRDRTGLPPEAAHAALPNGGGSHNPPSDRSPRRTAIPTAATAAAAEAVAMHAAERTDAVLPVFTAAQESVAEGAQTPPAQPRLTLSPTATAFSIVGDGVSGSPGSDAAAVEDRSNIEDRARWHTWQQQYTTDIARRQREEVYLTQRRLDNRPPLRTPTATSTDDPRSELVAAVAVARASIAAASARRGRPLNLQLLGVTPTVASTGVTHGGPTPTQQQSDGGRRPGLLERPSYMAVLTGEEPAPALGTTSGRSDETADDDGDTQRDLSVLPAFRHWESQRARLRIQWQEPDAQSDAIPTESLPSGGTLTLMEHPSAGPSPGGFGRGVPAEGVASDVEEAVFACLSSLGVRRLMLMRNRGTVTSGDSRRTPEWLNEWLHTGAYVTRSDGTAPPGEEPRCPHVGDVWELLELLLAWWAERVCTVAAGFPASRQASLGERGVGMGALAGDVAAAAQAVESVQGLRELKKCIMPLYQVRDFSRVGGGPTPRDAVLLKTLLVVHEGIAWATDRPMYRHYRHEVIPTALALYASLEQDTLEGVDLEVGHTLPESMFVVTGTVRPSWPRWGGNPSTPSSGDARSNSPNRVSISTNRNANEPNRDTTRPNVSINQLNRNSNGRFTANVIRGEGTNGGDRGSGMRCAGGWKGSQGFMPGPWVVFRVAREDYLEFYKSQEAFLDQAVGLSDEPGDMLC